MQRALWAAVILLGNLNHLLEAGLATEQVYLSGHGKDDAVPWDFMCSEGRRAGEWATLPVPSQWDVAGFGTLNYRKDSETARRELGHYRHEFAAPHDWSGSRVFLVFEGVMTDATAKLNGAQVGPTHQGSFYRFEYEITDKLKLGEKNLLEVEVAKHSANESVNRAERQGDYWLLAGIFRPVYLKIVPQAYIERVAIDAQADGSFAIDVFIDGATSQVTVTAQIETLAGEPVGELVSVAIDGEMVQLTTTIDSPALWSAETPNLYQVKVMLAEGEAPRHEITQRFGFRTIEVRKDDGIYVNGRRVILQGVNRHSFWPESGRCLSTDVHRLDIETIQAMNMNAVRMSHYPPDAEFLDLCDELGLYVLDELGGWHWAYDTEVGRKLVCEMVARDVNHPSILFWNNGNEGGNNVALDEVFGQYDPQQRWVLHPWEAFGPINTAHYLEYERAVVASKGVPTRHGWGKAYQEWEDSNDPNKYIYMPTEMLHGLYDGGAGAGLEDYWSMMRESPVLGGGFLWVLFDEALRHPETGQLDAAGNQAPDGIVGPYREREGSFFTIKELWSPIVVTRQDDDAILVENRYSFFDANQCTATWELIEFRTPEEKEAGRRVVASGRLELPSIPPGESRAVPLKLTAHSPAVDALAVRVDDPHGRELWRWVWPLRELAVIEPIAQAPSADAFSIADDDAFYTITCGEFAWRFRKNDGRLEEARRGEQAFSLRNGPIATPGESQLAGPLEFSNENGSQIVTARYTGSLQEVKWTMRPDGWLRCEYRYTAEGEHEYFGVTFDYPEDQVRGKRWLGEGPFRVWKNRRQGVTLGVWQNETNNTITGYRYEGYPEFKGCFSGVHWMQLETSEGPITIVPHDASQFVQVLTPELPPDELVAKTKVTLPTCGIAILDAIPPVGSKFKDTITSGPQGQPNVAEGEYHGAVSIRVGE